MSELIDLHYADGRPVAIAPDRVIRVEPAPDNKGTFVVMAVGETETAMTFAESFEDVRYYISEGSTTRMLRKMAEKDGRPFDRNNPFGAAAAF